MSRLLKQLFSEPSRPSGKVSKTDIGNSFKRLVGGLILAFAFWLSTDLAEVLNDGTRDAAYYIALIYSVADLIQVIARKAKEPDSSN